MTEVKPATHPLMGMDAREWAREFLHIWSGRWSEVDEGLMISWFANAIMRGFDEGRRRTDAEKDAEIARLKDENARLKAEVERLNLTVCRACSPSVHTPNACPTCDGTGRAR